MSFLNKIKSFFGLGETKTELTPIEEVTSTNSKAQQKLAMIRRFCEISSPDNNDELMTLYYR